jgi:hypothetical protein
MKNKSKITLIAMLIATSFAVPAFAQSSHRTGSALPYYYEGSGVQVRGQWGPAASKGPLTIQRPGLYDYAVTPGLGRSQGHGQRVTPTIARKHH